MLLHDILIKVESLGLYCRVVKLSTSPFQFICIANKFWIHIIDFKTYKTQVLSSEFFSSFMELCQQQEMDCMTVFEDQWYKQQPIILSRIIHTTQQSKRIFARTLELSNLDKTNAENFYNQNHLLGNVAGWKYIALQKQTVYALATFSKSRMMNYNLPHFRSYELLRFATLNHCSVTGGLSKILKHFIETTGATHIMTYTDSAFGSGKSFEKLGFKFVETLPPQAFIIGPNYKRIPAKRNTVTDSNLLKVYNAGSKKYVLDLR